MTLDYIMNEIDKKETKINNKKSISEMIDEIRFLGKRQQFVKKLKEMLDKSK